MSVAYPPAVSYFVRRIMGVTTNQYKIEPNGSPDNLGAGQIITFELPTNALLDLKSLKFIFGAKTVGGTVSRLPNKIDSLIERYSVEAGGLTIAQGFPQYNTVKHVKAIVTESWGKNKSLTTSTSHENIPRKRSDVTDGALTGEEDLSAEDYLAVTDFLGFLGESSPQVMDCSLLPNLVLKIYLANTTVLTNSAGTNLSGAASAAFNAEGTGTATYLINRAHLCCSVYGIMDGNYDRMVESKIVNEGFLEVPFKNYQTFQDGAHSGSSRFNLGCQSLDKLYAVFRSENYNTQSPPNLLAGMKRSEATGDVFVAATSAGSPTADFGTQFGVPLYENPVFNGEKYIAQTHEFPRPGGFATGQFNINGTLYPQWAATSGDWQKLTQDAMECDENQIMSYSQWVYHYHVMAIRLNLPHADKLRIISGLDTRSINLSGMFNTTGVTSSRALTLIAEYTSSLRIGSGLQLSLVI